MKEIFKDVKGYEGLYQVSNLGRVKSFIQWRGIENRFLKDRFDSKGYKQVALYKSGKSKNYRVHQLVAIVFLNHTPCGMTLCVDHIDNNKLNNRVENLQLITNRKNTSKDVKNKTSKYTGVSYDKKNNKWRVSIVIDKKQINLGRYVNEEYAAEIYKKALKN